MEVTVTVPSLWEYFDPSCASLLVGPNYCVLLRLSFSLRRMMHSKLPPSFSPSSITVKVEQVYCSSGMKHTLDSCVVISKLSAEWLLLLHIESPPVVPSGTFFVSLPLSKCYEMITLYSHMQSFSSVTSHRVLNGRWTRRLSPVCCIYIQTNRAAIRL